MNRKTYKGKTGCWNCHHITEYDIEKGLAIPEWVETTKPKCKRCNCVSVLFYDEYKINNSIMKDVLVHSRLNQELPEPPIKNTDHIG